MYCKTIALEYNLLKFTDLFLSIYFFIRKKPVVGTKSETENRKLGKFIKVLQGNCIAIHLVVGTSLKLDKQQQKLFVGGLNKDVSDEEHLLK